MCPSVSINNIKLIGLIAQIRFSLDLDSVSYIPTEVWIQIQLMNNDS